MSTEVTNNIDVLVDTTDVTLETTNNLVAANIHDVDIQEAVSTVEGYKKEYSIVGDGLYASVNVDEAPEWLTSIIDDVVNNAVASGMTDYDLLVQDVRNAIDAIDVASNTYVEQINIDATIDAVVTNRLQTLNATLENTYATIVDLDTAVVNAENALTTRAAQLEADYNSEIQAAVTSVTTAYSDADTSLANDITQLTNTFIDQESNISATADAVSGLQTYVGVDEDGQPDGTGILSSVESFSTAFTNLENGVTGPTGDIAYSLSNLQQSSEVYADDAATNVQNKFAYDSIININDAYYKAGFGLTAEAISAQTGDGLTPDTAYDSEFWINAAKFKFTNDNKTGASAPFTIDASGITPEVTFNGKVTFGSSQTGSVDEAIYAAISTIPLGDKNINITDNLIPTISFVVDTDNAGYQLVGNVTKVTTAGVDTFAEAQANLDTNGEVYSPYSDELQVPYYYRFAIHGTTDLSQFSLYEIDNDELVNPRSITYTLEPGVSLGSNEWYVVEGVVNPYGGNSTDYDGVIRNSSYDKIGTVRNMALTANPILFVLGWVAGGIPIKISRMKLAPITADTVAINNTLDYVDTRVDSIDVSSDILASQNSLAQNLGYADYAGLQAAATLGKTVINGGYLNTDLIEVDAISATQISAVDLSAVSAEVGELNMTAYPSYIRHSKGQVLDTSNSGFWLGIDSAGKAGFAIGDSDQFLRYHPDIGLQIAGSEIVAVNVGDVAFVTNDPGTYTFTNNTLKYTQFSFRMVGGGGGGGPSGGSGGSSSISVPGGSSYTASGGAGGSGLNNYSRSGRDAGITIVSYRDGDGGNGGYLVSFDFDLSYEGGYAGQVVTGNLTIPLGGTVNIVVGSYGSATGAGGSTPGYAGAVELVIEGV